MTGHRPPDEPLIGTPEITARANTDPQTNMKATAFPCCSFRLLGFFLGWISSVLLLQAQTGTGTITGRVFNPATGEYVRNAEIRLAGTNQLATSGDNGYFSLSNVAAGPATLTVSYTGYQPAQANVTVPAGGTAAAEIEIVSLEAAPAKPGDPVQLQQFVVSSDREGNAKAIMQQRNSMTMGTSVASDIFGEVTEGNVGEFLKYLPGVELEYVEADTRGPRLGGMDPEYTGVEIDGMKLASADAFIQYGSTENSSAGAGSRSFGFEQVSISSIESIEISRVPSADMSADSPAGVINMRTKRAFDRKGRRIGWSVSTVMNTEEFHLRKSVGPGDSHALKIRPNWSFDYAESFFNNRFGVLFSVKESNLYNEQYRVDHSWAASPTGSDTRPVVLTRLNFKDGPKWTKRFTTTLTSDFRATERLALSLAYTFNAYDARFYNRTLGFQAATNNTAATTGRQFVTGDGLDTFGTGGAAASARLVAPGGGNGIKLTNSWSLVPKFEYKHGSITVEGSLGYSRSRNDYDNLVRGTVGNAVVNSLSGIGFTATRSDPLNAEWNIVQTAGPDWADIRNYTNTRIGADGRWGFDEVWTGDLSARWTTPLKWPTWLKFGSRLRDQAKKYRNDGPANNYSFVGPGGNTLNANGSITTTGSYVNYESPFIFDMGQTGGSFTSISGAGVPPFGNRDALAGLLKSNPEYFVSTMSATDFYNAAVANTRDTHERVTAYYGMFNSRIAKLQIQGGLRWENTEVMAKEFDPLTSAEVRAAGFPVSTSDDRATTIPGLHYQYFTNPRVERRGEYARTFPTISAKYRFTDDLMFDIGWNKAIKRPNINDLNGLWRIDVENLVVNMGNPNLRPEETKKIAAGLSYYFTNVGSLTVQVSQTDVQNLAENFEFTAQELGITDPEFQDYEFRTKQSGTGSRRFRDMTISYRQQVGRFLPEFFRSTGVHLNYTRAYASQRRGGLTPHQLKGGFDFRRGRFAFNMGAVWQDEAPWTGTVGRFRRQNVKLDLGGSFRIARNMQVFFSGRNITQVPHRIFQSFNGGPKVLWRLENYGTNWTVGVKGNF